MKTYIFCFVLAVAIATATTEESGNTTTTTPKPTSTTPAPTPMPAPNTGNWTLMTKEGKICLMAQMGLQFNANYTNDKNKTVNFAWNFPNDTKAATGDCGTNASYILIDGDKTFGTVRLDFTKDDKNAQVSKITLTHNDLPGSTKSWVFIYDKQALFQAQVGNSYLCKSAQTVELNGTQAGSNASVETSNLQVQAFVQSKSPPKPGMFGDAQECPADAQTSNIVPIAVGAALAALVVIVLIAYLISRNRNKRGYESV